ncbi:MAG: LCP family protein [Peptoniphilaceae bacterium]|nr:LCP family protein [Peptoniphilaceae bacterium]MDY6085812.1 LCP family protein [Peptoniphilaceae bacterium]
MRRDDTESIDVGRVREEPVRKTPRKSCLGRGLKLVLLALLIVIVATLIFLALWDREKRDLPVPEAESGNTLRPIEDDVLVLLAGVDDTGARQAKRSDTLMLLRYDGKEGRFVGLSIPRDTRVMIQGEKDKINHAYAYGGIELTMRTIRHFLGIDLDYYMIVDYETVRAIVDAMGGVRYDVPETLTPRPAEQFETGDHVLDGAEALAFLRHRKSYAMGDIGRVAAQQDFFKTMAKQLLSPMKVPRYPFVLQAIRKNAKTNLPAVSLLPMVPSFLHQGKALDMETVPGEGRMIDGVSYYVAYPEETLELVDELFGPYVEE